MYLNINLVLSIMFCFTIDVPDSKEHSLKQGKDVYPLEDEYMKSNNSIDKGKLFL